LNNNTIDYEEVGLIAGLEVHQQLLTERKLFCNCPAGLYTTEHDGEVLRHMRPTLSELGEYDGTALMEFKTKKNIIYLLHQSNVCTYELDDTPPFLINQHALDMAVEQCLMLGCDIIDEVHVARKQYLDGSIPTGFQRTAIAGVDGKLPFMGRELSITQVSVEEDSCREVSDHGHLMVWRTDRLGMPLIETVTGPDLRTPDEVVEAILLIGRVCRSTGHVRVGMGASRQDVNVSVRGGRRVEIKGVPKAGWARALVHGEAVRQVNLLKLRDELHGRGFKKPEDLDITHKEITYMVRNSELSMLKRENYDATMREGSQHPDLEFGEGPFCVRAVRLGGMAGTLSWPGQPDLTFAHELAGRVRVIAGLDQQPILLNSEKWPDAAGSKSEWRKIKRTLGCGSKDAFVVVWGPEEDTITAAKEIELRYADALDGIPNETRQPFEDGMTDFERILPGPDRMYPDTDSPPVRITRERVERLTEALPPPPWVREDKYAAAGVPRDTIHFLIRRGGAGVVDEVLQESGADTRLVCLFVGERLKGLRRDGIAVDEVPVERWIELFTLINERPVLGEVITTLARKIAVTPDKAVTGIVEETGLNQESAGWENRISVLIESVQPDYDDGTLLKAHRFYMGQIMTDLRGKVPGKNVADVVEEQLIATGRKTAGRIRDEQK
jgi:glutamyl-tRNA(Gln) amidotransferase subunit E